jgi:hypothetical protein
MANSSQAGAQAVKDGNQFVKKIASHLNIGVPEDNIPSEIKEITNRIIKESCNEDCNALIFFNTDSKTRVEGEAEPKADIWVNALFRRGEIKPVRHEIGLSLKYNDENSINLDTKSLKKIFANSPEIIKRYPNGYIGLQKLLGEGKYAHQFDLDYPHDPGRGHYMMNELLLIERQELVKFQNDIEVLKVILKNAFMGSGKRQAHVLIYPQKKGSIKNKDLIIKNIQRIIEIILCDHERNPFRHDNEIDTVNPPKAVIKANNKGKDSFYNTIAFVGGLITLQRRGSNQDTLQTKINLKLLTRLIKSDNSENKVKGGQNARITSAIFKEVAVKYLVEQGHNPAEFIFRASSNRTELGSGSFDELLKKDMNNPIFDWSGVDRQVVINTLNKYLGTPEGKLLINESLSRAAKTHYKNYDKFLPEEKRHARLFIRKNMLCFVEYLIFKKDTENYQYIILNKCNYGDDLHFDPQILTKAQFLNLVKQQMQQLQLDDNWSSSMKLGVLNMKRCGSGSEKNKCKIALTFNARMPKVLNNLSPINYALIQPPKMPYLKVLKMYSNQTPLMLPAPLH